LAACYDIESRADRFANRAKRPGSIGVLQALDKPVPIRMAIGQTEERLAVRSLHVHGADVPGRSLIIDRQSLENDGLTNLSTTKGSPASRIHSEARADC
jgi:hypothetical protein